MIGLNHLAARPAFVEQSAMRECMAQATCPTQAVALDPRPLSFRLFSTLHSLTSRRYYLFVFSTYVFNPVSLS